VLRRLSSPVMQPLVVREGTEPASSARWHGEDDPLTRPTDSPDRMLARGIPAVLALDGIQLIEVLRPRTNEFGEVVIRDQDPLPMDADQNGFFSSSHTSGSTDTRWTGSQDDGLSFGPRLDVNRGRCDATGGVFVRQGWQSEVSAATGRGGRTSSVKSTSAQCNPLERHFSRCATDGNFSAVNGA